MTLRELFQGAELDMLTDDLAGVADMIDGVCGHGHPLDADQIRFAGMLLLSLAEKVPVVED